ncbi:MAG TPA: hypothetical protein DCY07_03920 [Rhodospirillaceae bacterium]|nr:hypothetical protein [Rhodospirillaceae bacterium]
MFDDSDRDRLKSLAKRIDQAQKAADPAAGKEDGESSSRKRQTVEAIRVGSDFIALIVLSGALGWYLDRELETTPWLMLTLLSVGFVLGFWFLYYFLTKKTKDDVG